MPLSRWVKSHDPGTRNQAARIVRPQDRLETLGEGRRDCIAVSVVRQREVHILVVRERAAIAMDRQQGSANQVERHAGRSQGIAGGEQCTLDLGACRCSLVLARCDRCGRGIRCRMQVRPQRFQCVQCMLAYGDGIPGQARVFRQRLVKPPCTGVGKHRQFQCPACLASAIDCLQHLRIVQCCGLQPRGQGQRPMHGLGGIAPLPQLPAGHSEIHPRVAAALIQLQGALRMLAGALRIAQRHAKGGQVRPTGGMQEVVLGCNQIGKLGARTIPGRQRMRGPLDAARAQLRGLGNPDLQLQGVHKSSRLCGRLPNSRRQQAIPHCFRLDDRAVHQQLIAECQGLRPLPLPQRGQQAQQHQVDRARH